METAGQKDWPKLAFGALPEWEMLVPDAAAQTLSFRVAAQSRQVQSRRDSVNHREYAVCCLASTSHMLPGKDSGLSGLQMRSSPTVPEVYLESLQEFA